MRNTAPAVGLLAGLAFLLVTGQLYGAGGGGMGGSGGAMGGSTATGGGTNASGPAGHNVGPGSQGSVSGGGAMAHGETATHALMPMVLQMNDMMNSIAEIMKGQMSPENLVKASEVMRNMSREMANMSRMMIKGRPSGNEMRMMEVRMVNMQRTLEGMQTR